MNEAEILTKALAAQSASGPTAPVEIFLDRVPNTRYVKQLRVRPKQGPWGRIVALTPAGTTVEFEAHKLIAFFSSLKKTTGKKSLQARTVERVQIHPVLLRSTVERITEISAAQNLTQSAVIDIALSEYLKRYA